MIYLREAVHTGRPLLLGAIAFEWVEQMRVKRSLFLHAWARDGKGLAPRLAGPERSEALDSPTPRFAGMPPPENRLPG
jgi:hypothetical protein